MLAWGGKNRSPKASFFFNCEVIFSVFKAHSITLPPLRSKLHLVSLSYAPSTSSMLSLYHMVRSRLHIFFKYILKLLEIIILPKIMHIF
jgi:hypothetical protein